MLQQVWSNGNTEKDPRLISIKAKLILSLWISERRRARPSSLSSRELLLGRLQSTGQTWNKVIHKHPCILIASTFLLASKKCFPQYSFSPYLSASSGPGFFLFGIVKGGELLALFSIHQN